MKFRHCYIKLRRLLITISYLKVTQIIWRIYYRLRCYVFINTKIKLQKTPKLKICYKFQKGNDVLYNEKKFNFLNKQILFVGEVDWNYNQVEKLWKNG